MFGIKKNSVESLIKEGDAILDVFTKTQEKCNILNEKIAGEIASKEAEIKTLTSDVSTLNNLTSKYTKVIQKIDAIIGS